MKDLFRSSFSVMHRAMADLLSPPFCAVCGCFLSEREHVCVRCRRGIVPPVTCTLEITRAYHMTVYALSGYEGVVRKLILSKNYGSPIQSRQLGELMAVDNFCPWQQFDYIIPVPLHWTRYSWRGFNQAAILARAISARHGVPVLAAARRVGKTAQQTTLAYAARQQNVRHIFQIKPSVAHMLRDKRLLLIDDVLTTGATMSALARVFVDVKPASISAVVAARVL